MKQRIFWGSVLVCLACANNLGAVLYANVTPMDTGGFISLSPLVDCVFWGFLIALCALAAFLTRRSGRAVQIPDALRFPVAWLGVLAGFSIFILAAGALSLFYPYSRFQLPFWAYGILTVSGYLAGGFLFGRRDRGKLYWGLLWAVLIAVLLAHMGLSMLREAQLQDAPWQAQAAAGSYIPSSASGLIRHGTYGDILGRLCLPLCLMFESYYDELEPISREIQIMLACLCPAVLFAAGWLAGRLYKGR